MSSPFDTSPSTQPVPRHYAQLVSVTCLFIAAKMEEVRMHPLGTLKHPPTQERYPSLSLCTRVSDNAFRPDDVLRMEQLVLNTLGFQLHLPTALSYLGTLTTILDVDADVAQRAAFIAVRLIKRFDEYSTGGTCCCTMHHCTRDPAGAVPVGCHV